MLKAIHIVPVMMLAGCASAPAYSCLDADWRAVGYGDGAAGRPLDEIAPGYERCFKGQVAFDVDAYLWGRNEGLSVYCTPANGYRAGADGETYEGVCRTREPRFEASYRLGRMIFDLKTAALTAEQRIATAEAELWEIKQRETMVDIALRSPSSERADRLDYRAELEGLAEARTRLEAEIEELFRDRARAEEELATAEASQPEAFPAGGTVQALQASY